MAPVRFKEMALAVPTLRCWTRRFQAPGTTTQCVRMSLDGSVLYVGYTPARRITTRASSPDGGWHWRRMPRSQQKSPNPGV